MSISNCKSQCNDCCGHCDCCECPGDCQCDCCNNCCPVCCFPVIPVCNTYDFNFRKVDEMTGTGLAGATFVLLQDGGFVADASSSTAGLVQFTGLSPGHYTMVETIPPDGYQANELFYFVVIDFNGNVTINGVLASSFTIYNTPEVLQQSSQPAVTTVHHCTQVVVGTGVPRSTITLIWPNGVSTQHVVRGNGVWLAPLIDNFVLQPGHILQVYQTTPGMAPSEPVSIVVIPRF